MFGFQKADPLQKLQKAYEAKTAEAIALQRKGDIRGFARATEEAEALLAQIDAIQKS
ncbi:MAG: Lacal_2735 family protein [Planctomycetes bacterium]|nr:Lacal_2735 family protein [Planctomycetota bacterium]HPF14980.1 DUF6435 family protein [Planctomycetota bacterium]HRV81041.1 DUF6435 family protein [Planctomycetota bacterium]